MKKLLDKDSLSGYLSKLQYLQRACLGREGYVDLYIKGSTVYFEFYGRKDDLLLGFVLEEGETTEADARSYYDELLKMIKKEGLL